MHLMHPNYWQITIIYTHTHTHTCNTYINVFMCVYVYVFACVSLLCACKCIHTVYVCTYLCVCTLCDCESMPMFVYSVCTTRMDIILHTIAQKYGECTVLVPCKMVEQSSSSWKATHLDGRQWLTST